MTKDMETIKHAQKLFEEKMNKKMDSFLKDNRLKTFMDTINSEFCTFKESIVKEFKVLSEEVKELKASLEFSQAEIEDIKKVTESVNTLDKKVDTIQVQLDQSSNLLDYLDNQMRRNNLRIEGVSEIENESWEKTETLVKSTLADKLQFTPDQISNMTIERAHRVKSSGMSHLSAHKPIVVRFTSFKSRDVVLKACRIHKPAGLHVFEDFSGRVMKRRKELLPEMYAKRHEGKIAYLSYNKLIVKERPAQIPVRRGSVNRIH